jgi:hypothetical protein
MSDAQKLVIETEPLAPSFLFMVQSQLDRNSLTNNSGSEVLLKQRSFREEMTWIGLRGLS